MDSAKLTASLNRGNSNCTFLIVSIANTQSLRLQNLLCDRWLGQLLQLMNNMRHSWAHRRDMLCTSVYKVHHLLHNTSFWNIRGRRRYDRIQELKVAMWLHQRCGPFKYTLPTNRINSLCRSTTTYNFQQQYSEAVNVTFCCKLISIYKFRSEVSICATSHHCPLLHHFPWHKLWKTNPHQMCAKLFIKQYITGTNIPMHNMWLNLVMQEPVFSR